MTTEAQLDAAARLLAQRLLRMLYVEDWCQLDSLPPTLRHVAQRDLRHRYAALGLADTASPRMPA